MQSPKKIWPVFDGAQLMGFGLFRNGECPFAVNIKALCLDGPLTLRIEDLFNQKVIVKGSPQGATPNDNDDTENPRDSDVILDDCDGGDSCFGAAIADGDGVSSDKIEGAAHHLPEPSSKLEGQRLRCQNLVTIQLAVVILRKLFYLLQIMLCISIKFSILAKGSRLKAANG
ncbi:unnamed protein product [Orchesella dallaii]|uniref:Uncharacterized protein n=1 Tax=Orchesella dallaii TaxID=48710 RepID=A0ABP1QDK4_9HEXA